MGALTVARRLALAAFFWCDKEPIMIMHTTTAPHHQELRSVYTASLPALFAQHHLSLAVSSAQAGKVILVRRPAGPPADGHGPAGTINTHFCTFQRAMGIAMHGDRLAIGGEQTVWELQNMPALARTLEPSGHHDACYLPRRMHVTGAIDIHDIAYAADGELWLVNTLFGCLCTLDAAQGLRPRWRPPFATAYAPEDRCHLNGLALVDGRPKYVTALGETDTPEGWRANRARGGILIDVETNEVLLRGLSMPHSPRWYGDRLWLLESGEGSLAWVDLERRTWHTVCQLPGFTRGLDFSGPLAFIGLSRPRRSPRMSDLPLEERLREAESACTFSGVWVVNIVTGQTVGFWRLETDVHQLFAVQVLPGIRFPELLDWDDKRAGFASVLLEAELAETPYPTLAEEHRFKTSPCVHKVPA